MPLASSRARRSRGVKIELLVRTRNRRPCSCRAAMNSAAPGMTLSSWTRTPSMSVSQHSTGFGCGHAPIVPTCAARFGGAPAAGPRSTLEVPEGGARHVIGHERSRGAASCRGHRSREGFLRPAGPAVPGDERRGQPDVPAQRRHDADAAARGRPGRRTPAPPSPGRSATSPPRSADLEGRGVVFEDYDLPDSRPSTTSPRWVASGRRGSSTPTATSCASTRWAASRSPDAAPRGRPASVTRRGLRRPRWRGRR